MLQRGAQWTVSSYLRHRRDDERNIVMTRSKQVRIGVVGFGEWGPNQTSGAARPVSPRWTVTGAIHDRMGCGNPAAIRKEAQRYGLVKAVKGIQIE